MDEEVIAWVAAHVAPACRPGAGYRSLMVEMDAVVLGYNGAWLAARNYWRVFGRFGPTTGELNGCYLASDLVEAAAARGDQELPRIPDQFGAFRPSNVVRDPFINSRHWKARRKKLRVADMVSRCDGGAANMQTLIDKTTPHPVDAHVWLDTTLVTELLAMCPSETVSVVRSRPTQLVAFESDSWKSVMTPLRPESAPVQRAADTSALP